MSLRDADDDDEEMEDDSPLVLPPEYRDLQAEAREVSVRELWARYMQRSLILQAEFQREYVWDDTRASRFIESLLLNLPTPQIFLAENKDGTWDVVDGHQRLESLFGFLQPLATGPAAGAVEKPRFRALVLKNLEVLEELVGRGVTALGVPDRESLLERHLTTVSIPKTANPDLRFVLFARLNLGSVPLNQQELRNCLYRGPYNGLVKELAGNPAVLAFFGKAKPDKRMRQREMILRFFALVHRFAQYRTPYSGFLNDEMESNQDASPSDIREFKGQFLSALRWTQRVFGSQSSKLFRLGDHSSRPGRWDRWMELIYEVEMVHFCLFADELARVSSELTSPEDLERGLRHTLIGVMVGERFLDTLREGTRRPERMQLRFNLWSSAMARAIENPDMVIHEVRELTEAVRFGCVCSRCHIPIESLDDTARLPGDGGFVHRLCHREWATTLPETLTTRSHTADHSSDAYRESESSA